MNQTQEEKRAAAGTTAEEIAMKCQYLGCTKEATETAIGGDWNGDEHVYHVCLEHAAEMEPYHFREKWAAAQEVATTQSND